MSLDDRSVPVKDPKFGMTAFCKNVYERTLKFYAYHFNQNEIFHKIIIQMQNFV